MLLLGGAQCERRKAAKIEGIEQYDFDKLAKTERSPRERRRFQAFDHLREGGRGYRSSLSTGAAQVFDENGSRDLKRKVSKG